ncbi:MAG TPA: monovalent cation/H+ antiporter complex subunit F [Bryobacteraceae bacterium]|nr:monovalent cation/H+ antiporter complex subunit F [Bryobacteraceae bacterium]HOQ46975.1 monovalent cation/H+ antiporter complex subunit F [Bryobacteraceae bacterium]HPU73098.1 monovalent cation/H+ antiporter complex subunit F [Bryobacteraceae bacterium]
MTPFAEGIAASAAGAAIVLLSIAVVLALIRLILGPGLPDRVVALDLMSTLAVGVIGAYCVVTNESSILDAALIVALVAFLGTVAFASFLERGRRR